MIDGESGSVGGCIFVGALCALVLLGLGIAVPLAGGTDFNGLPRAIGLVAVVAMWAIAVIAALRRHRWIWLAVVVALGPLPLIAYSAFSTDSLSNPEAWDAFDSAPWEMLALMLSPVPLLVYGLRGGEGKSG